MARSKKPTQKDTGGDEGFFVLKQAISTFEANVVSSAQLRSSCLNKCSFRAEVKRASPLNLI